MNDLENDSLVRLEKEDNQDIDISNKLKEQLSLTDDKEKVNKVLENAIGVKVAGEALRDNNLVNKLVDNKSKILEQQSKSEVFVNDKKIEKNIMELI